MSSADTRVRTSVSHPLRIDPLAVPGTTGVIGMTICPGKQQRRAASGAWRRDLDADLAAIAAWGAVIIVNLVEDHEMRELGVADTAARIPAGIEYLRLPIPDAGIPDERWEAQWTLLAPRLHARLRAGQRILVHCKGGLGRTGLVAARLLVESGVAARDAVRRVRAARAHTIETSAQLEWVLCLRVPRATGGER